MNKVCTYNGEGNMVYEASFINADTAYQEFREIVENMKSYLPKNRILTVIRFNDDRIMNFETIVGVAC